VSQRPVITSDGNQTLAVIERFKRALSDNPKDFPALTAAHLMGGEATSALDTRVRNELDTLMSRELRARAVGAFLFKILRDAHPILLYDVYLLQRKGFVTLLKETTRPDSMASGLEDKDLELAWEVFERNMQILAKTGANLRKRKDWR
jgi:hypothetical protein